jgi:hypothetical protein
VKACRRRFLRPREHRWSEWFAENSSSNAISRVCEHGCGAWDFSTMWTVDGADILPRDRFPKPQAPAYIERAAP